MDESELPPDAETWTPAEKIEWLEREARLCEVWLNRKCEWPHHRRQTLACMIKLREEAQQIRAGQAA